MHLEYESLRRLGRFSLDDPDAGRKLVENLDRRRVRFQAVELCWHFGFPFPSYAVRERVKAFLAGLIARGEILEPVAGLYCRPDMLEGRASVDDAVKQLIGLRELQRSRKAKLKVERPVPKPVPRKPPKVRVPRQIVMTKPPEAPMPAEPSPPAPAPKPRSISSLQRQTEWILLWIRARGGQAPKAAMAAAAVAEGIVGAQTDIDVPLQNLFNRTRAYIKDHLLTLTQFGERDAEYLDLRRDALGTSTDGA